MTRPFRSQSPYLVGSLPRGPPTSPVSGRVSFGKGSGLYCFTTVGPELSFLSTKGDSLGTLAVLDDVVEIWGDFMLDERGLLQFFRVFLAIVVNMATKRKR